MPRGISGALGAALVADPVPIFTLVEALFDSGALRLWTGLGTLAWDGKTWAGVGGLMSFNFPSETGELRAAGGTIELNGMDPAIVAIADTENARGRQVTIWIGAFDSAGAVIVDPDIAFRGTADTMEINEDGETARVSLTVESRFADFDRPRERRYTPEDQALSYPGDKGFDFVAALQDKDIRWGGSS